MFTATPACWISPQKSATRLDTWIQEISPSAPVPGRFWKWAKWIGPNDFVHLDAGSEWAAWVAPYIYLAEGNVAEARQAAQNMGKAPYYHRELMQACSAVQRPPDFAKIVRETESSVVTDPDPEAWYHVGALMAACGQSEPALRLLKLAVQQNYCAYSGLLDDPMLKDLRKETAFNEVLTSASNCQDLVKEPRQ